MKKLLSIVLFTCFTTGWAQETDVWRIGAQFGFQGNKAELIGGQKMADSRFEQHNAGVAGLNFYARYDYDQHWMLLTGLGISSYGFEFSLAQNYSLLSPDSRRMTVKNSMGLLEVPFILHYKFEPNCKQVKWLVGAGFIQTLQTEVNNRQSFVGSTESNPGISFLSSEVQQNKSLFPTCRFTVGKEKTFAAGDILNISLLLNYGFAQNAKATVRYNIDGQSYMHEFGNKGNFVGLRISYYLAPFQK